MLDSFLKVAYAREKKAEDQDRIVETMRKFPEEYLHKLASGEEKLSYGLIGSSSLDGGDSWLDQFKGTPLFEQALELEKQELQQRMSEKARWREEDARRMEQSAARDEICIQRKLLEIQLAEAEAGVGDTALDEEAPSEDMGGEPGELPPEEPVEEEPAPQQLQEPQEQPSAPPQQDSKPKVDVKVAAAKLRFALAKEKLAAKDDEFGRDWAETTYSSHAGRQRKPTLESVRGPGDKELETDVKDWQDTAKSMEESPGTFRARRGVAGGILGGGVGAGLGALIAKRPGLGAALGAGVGALGGAASPVKPESAQDAAQSIASLPPEVRDEIAAGVLEDHIPPSEAIGGTLGALGGLGAGIAYSKHVDRVPAFNTPTSKAIAGAAAPLVGMFGGSFAGRGLGKLHDKYVPEKKPSEAEKEAAANFQKTAIGLGLLAKTVGGAAKRVGKSGMGAAGTARDFGGTRMDAARMGMGAVKGQTEKVAPTVGRAAKSYIKNNPLQAAGLAAGAGLGTGVALS